MNWARVILATNILMTHIVRFDLGEIKAKNIAEIRYGAAWGYDLSVEEKMDIYNYICLYSDDGVSAEPFAIKMR